MNKYTVIHGDCLKIMETYPFSANCIFADPPDNIGLKYDDYSDKLPVGEYEALLRKWVRLFIDRAGVVWLSFNPKWTLAMAEICRELIQENRELLFKPCVQVFTFGQNNPYDLGNNHRSLWRLHWADAMLYPDAIKVPSWRQLNGDKRAKEGGRVPGDVFDFPRVTGNSKQRRKWHPTQLNENLVERCIKLSTLEGETVLDPFGGTGTTLRVCKRINRSCTLIEMNAGYCEKIAAENDLPASKAA